MIHRGGRGSLHGLGPGYILGSGVELFKLLQNTFMCPSSVAGVPFDLVRRFWASFLLHLHLCAFLAVWKSNQKKNNKEEDMTFGWKKG